MLKNMAVSLVSKWRIMCVCSCCMTIILLPEDCACCGIVVVFTPVGNSIPSSGLFSAPQFASWQLNSVREMEEWCL